MNESHYVFPLELDVATASASKPAMALLLVTFADSALLALYAITDPPRFLSGGQSFPRVEFEEFERAARHLIGEFFL
jgi:hypothetical protein